ncbi:MAG: sulfotransferase [Promethearchaeia archaeon]
MKKEKIKEPIYVTGLARAGTTINLEILNKHPDTATHKYLHMPLPYLPYFWTKLAEKTSIFIEPRQRLHKDGIIVNRESPEALEEIIWDKFFDDYKSELKSNIFDENISNKDFEDFYKNHILKLLVKENASRYVAKNNYNITRMSYLLQLFPEAKFLLVIRNPINHIASTIKQCQIFEKMGENDQKLKRMTEIIGHHEFGPSKIYINVNNTQTVKRIKKLWDKEKNIKGWVLYWKSVYDFAAKQLKKNKRLRKNTLIVRYEDLCKEPRKMINKILTHTNLSKGKFQKIKEYYVKKIRCPDYYDFKFSKDELKMISNITKKTTDFFGYNGINDLRKKSPSL